MNKSEFLAATKCITMAWYQTRHESPPLDDGTRFRMEQGREVGEFARRLFHNGTPVRGHDEPAIAETQKLIADDVTETIFEATVRSGVFTAKADVLNRNGDGWDVIEVKSGFSDSDRYVDDLAYTVMVLRRAGVTVKRSVLLLLSRNYRHGDPVDKLFTQLDKTGAVDSRSKAFGEDAAAMSGAVLADHVPQPTLNRACRKCDFFETLCLGSRYEHTVLELPNLHHSKFKKLCVRGIVNVADVPADLELNELQQRVKIAAETGEPFVAAAGLGRALAAIEWPCHYLDFETVAPTTPLYDGYGCHHQVLTQFSIHHRDSLDAETRHSEFLADATESQEQLLAEHLVEALGTRGAVIVYSHFEDVRIKTLISQFPELAVPLSAIRARLVDFEKIIRKHVYHPAFVGSFSLKKVVPALVPAVSYDGLVVADGDNAVAMFARMARGEIEDVAEARKHLLAYCETDTFVMVKLHEILAGMATLDAGSGVNPGSGTEER